MVNESHLEILKQGFKVWNSWREEYHDVRPDLSGAHLPEADLYEANLIGADLFYADLTDADLSGANLSGANLSHAELTDANLSGADLSGADLSNADLSGADLSNADLSGADLSNANITNADLTGADLTDAGLTLAVRSSTANESHLEILKQGVDEWNSWRDKYSEVRPNLSEAHLSFAHLSGANLSGAILVDAYLSNADLRGADLSLADLTRAHLYKAKLTDANLSGATLREAHLYKAVLSHANLSHATLYSADLSNADLTGTDLSDANLTRAIFVETTIADAIFAGCAVYGSSVWNLQGKPKDQSNLNISNIYEREPVITVDDLEVAQFIYLLTKYEKLRNVIDIMTSKVVLLLGRFTDEQKPTLDAVRDELRHHDYVPVVFDFEKPESQTFIETVSTLARMAQFVIADFTDPEMVPIEVQHIADTGAAVPILPIRVASEKAKGEHMVLIGLRKKLETMILDTYWYEDTADLVKSINKNVIEPAKAVSQEAIKGDRERSAKLVQAFREKQQRQG